MLCHSPTRLRAFPIHTVYVCVCILHVSSRTPLLGAMLLDQPSAFIKHGLEQISPPMPANDPTLRQTKQLSCFSSHVAHHVYIASHVVFGIVIAIITAKIVSYY